MSLLPRLLPAVAALAALAGCGAPQAEPTFRMHGVAVVVASGAPFAHRPDFAARLEGTVATALAYWGGDWSRLEGATLTLVDAATVYCQGAAALGCYDGDISFTTRDPGSGTFSCVEATVLVHEVGHAAIGDPDHLDPRWMEMDAVASALGGQVGYAPDGEVPCIISVSVWRHPLGSP